MTADGCDGGSAHEESKGYNITAFTWNHTARALIDIITSCEASG